MAAPVPSPQLCSEAAPTHALSPPALPSLWPAPGTGLGWQHQGPGRARSPHAEEMGGNTTVPAHQSCLLLPPRPGVGEDVFVFIQPLEISSVPGYLCWLVIMRDTAGT